MMAEVMQSLLPGYLSANSHVAQGFSSITMSNCLVDMGGCLGSSTLLPEMRCGRLSACRGVRHNRQLVPRASVSGNVPLWETSPLARKPASGNRPLVGMWMAPFRNNRWAFRRSALPIMGRNLTAIRWLHLSSWIMVLQW
jgi:hypothetical protein